MENGGEDGSYTGTLFCCCSSINCIFKLIKIVISEAALFSDRE